MNSNDLHHDNHKLNSIKKKIESHDYNNLSEKEILYISNEIESGKITLEEVEKWMKKK